MFERTQCKHPVIVLNDVSSSDLEALLNYMYEGEVSVLQDKLANLIRAAEALKIKGLAITEGEEDQSAHDSSSAQSSSSNKRTRDEDAQSSKKRRQDDPEDSISNSREIRRNRRESNRETRSSNDNENSRASKDNTEEEVRFDDFLIYFEASKPK